MAALRTSRDPHRLAICLLFFASCALSTPDGQLFCKLDTGATGSIVVGVIEAAEGFAPGVAGLAVLATNAAKQVVDENCALAAAVIPAVTKATAVPPPAVDFGQIAIVPVPGTPTAVILKGVAS